MKAYIIHSLEAISQDRNFIVHCSDAAHAVIDDALQFLRQATEDPVEQFLDEVRAELQHARSKFPGDRLMTVALAEEFGELCKAVLDEPAERVRKEAVQTAVMAARVVLDGDGSVQEWRQAKGLDRIGSSQSPPAITPRQREILRHAVGWPLMNRNRFVTGESTIDYPDCMALVEAGLMDRSEGSQLSGGDYVFTVTEAGKNVACEIGGAHG